MLMRVGIQQGLRQSASVPESAIQYEGDSAFAYRIAAGERGTTAQRVTVETGAVENGFVEILAGLSPEDRVVGSGLNRIQPNAPVMVARAGAEKGAAQAPQAAAGSAASPQAATR